MLNKSLGIKFDSEKLDWTLIPFEGLEEVVRVLQYGEKKYTQEINGEIISGRENWKIVEGAEERYLKAAFRHIISYKNGEKDDPESNFSHLAHATCCLLYLLWFEHQQKQYPSGKELISANR